MITFRAMTTEVAVTAPAVDPTREHSMAAAVAKVFAVAEQRFSRFRASSELSRLNRSTGPVAVSAAMFDALLAARHHMERTGGLFDPGVGGALGALGYDRSFRPGALDVDRPPERAPRASFREVVLDAGRRVVHRPAHVRIDLGGLIKGRTVDAAAALLPAPAAVDAGGDAVLRGADLDGSGWLVDVEDPADPERVLVTLRVIDRAVATSAGNRRRWRRGGALLHHIIDPRTGLPADTDLVQVTALAPTAELADVLAKAALLAGSRGARTLLAAHPGTGAVLVGGGGRTELHGDLEVVDA